MNLSIQNCSAVLRAEFIGIQKNTLIDAIAIDSRSLQNSATTLFFALAGPNNDAHIYIEELISKGVQNFVVTHIPDGVQAKANFLVVKNTLEALQKLAAYYRSLFDIPVVGITGSNGKTIVKEWLNFLLSPDYTIIRSPKSYNSQVGVPLSVFGINEQHNFGIFEAGISTVSEMEKLEPIIRPTIGVLTNIGSAHDEGFADVNEKIIEKLRLFDHSQILIYQKNKAVSALIPTKINTFSWSFVDASADVFVAKTQRGSQTKLNITHVKEVFEIEIPFLDEASIENAISCLLVLLYLKYDLGSIQDRIQLLYPVEMRLKLKNGTNNCSLIDDSYSADFQSLKIALDFLESQKQSTKKTLILSDIFQSGLTNDALYSRVGQLIISNKISRFIGIGTVISQFKNQFENCVTFDTKS
jgi:alanine racemase